MTVDAQLANSWGIDEDKDRKFWNSLRQLNYRESVATSLSKRYSYCGFLKRGRNMKILIPILVVSFLGGCGTIDAKMMAGPNGTPAYSMQCSGMGRTLEACYEKAGELCSNGYLVLDKPSRTVGVTNPATGQFILAEQQSLFVECK